MRQMLLNLTVGFALACAIVNLVMARNALCLLAGSLGHAFAIPELGCRAAQLP
jgi:hypothetical protein